MNRCRTLNDCVRRLPHSSELFITSFACVRQTSLSSAIHFDIAVLASERFVTFNPCVNFSILARELFEEVLRLLFAYIELACERSRACSVHCRQYPRFHHIAVNCATSALVCWLVE